MSESPGALRPLLTASRRQFGLTQPRMADLLGVSLRQYQRWERDSSTPRPREWARIVAQLELDTRLAAAAPDVPRLTAELTSLRLQIDGLQSEVRRLEAHLELVGSAA